MTFYVLSTPRAGSAEERLSGTEVKLASGFRTGEAPVCSTCGKFTGLRPWLPPYRVEIDAWGKRFGDIAFSNVGDDIFVSPRFTEAWQREGLTGLSGFERVEIVKVRRHSRSIAEPPAYMKARVLRSGAEVDYAASGFEWLANAPTCPSCRIGNGVKRRKGIVINPTTWSGEDIFIARAAAEFIVSERFKEFCNTFGIANAVLSPAETFAQDYYRWESEKNRSEAERH